MSDLAIRVEQLGKEYSIGKTQSATRTLREVLVDVAKAPFRKIGRVLRGESSGMGELDSIWALKDVSFEVKQGEAIGVIGRNGAGKSTLLKILSRITHPTAGFAEMRGRIGSLLEVGTGFHPELTGRENIYLNGAVLGMRRSEIQRQFDAIVDFSEVSKFIDTPVKHYSSGMYLRLAFAVAAHLNPEILLVDEVLAVGDADFQRKCLGKMESVAGEGRTVLFVSHNMAAVQRLCTRAVFLKDGTVAEVGGVNEVVTHYLRAGTTQLGERVWDDLAKAPGGKVARLRAVRARRADGKVSAEFKTTEAFDLELEFSVLEAGHQMNVSFFFYDQQGGLMFMVGDFQDKTWDTQPRPLGLHRTSCRIPGDLLNEGRISILAGVSTFPGTSHAIERDAIALRIDDDMRPVGARGSCPREWPGGVVRPLFDWKSDHTREP